MKLIWLASAICALTTPISLNADTVLAATAIRAGSVLKASDLTVSDVKIVGAVHEVEQAIGRETNRNLFPGHAIFLDDLEKPRVVKRNQLVALIFNKGGLRIEAEGRALEDGGVGDRIRILNAASRTTIYGKILPDGSISVSGV